MYSREREKEQRDKYYAILEEEMGGPKDMEKLQKRMSS